MEHELRTPGSRLREFIGSDSNSTAREFLLMNRLVYDLMAAAAAMGYHLLVYKSQVDEDGFDLILDDRDVQRKIQVKSAIQPGGRKQWDIHKGVLKPEKSSARSFGFPLDPHGTGMGGGVVLLEVAPSAVDASMSITYGLVDIYVLAAIRLGIISLGQSKAQAAAVSLYDRIKGATRETVVVTRGSFLRAQSAEHLLALLGLRSRMQANWHYLLTLVAEQEFTSGAATELPAPVEVLKESVAMEIASCF